MARKLSLQRARFVVLLLEGKTQTAAYKGAGYVASNDRVATTNAQRLFKTEAVQGALAQARAAAAQRAVVTVETIAAELDHVAAVALAADPPQTSAAVAAALGKAKLYGLLVDRKLIDTVIHKPALHSKALELSEEEWQRQFDPRA